MSERLVSVRNGAACLHDGDSALLQLHGLVAHQLLHAVAEQLLLAQRLQKHLPRVQAVQAPEHGCAGGTIIGIRKVHIRCSHTHVRAYVHTCKYPFIIIFYVDIVKCICIFKSL